MSEDLYTRPVFSSSERDLYEGSLVNSLIEKCKKPLPDPTTWLEKGAEGNPLVKPVDLVLNWGRHWSVWPVSFGLACCAIEMICTALSRFDISRFGMELFRASPRQADLLLVAGTITWKMAPALKRIYDQVPEPKWVVAMGSCATSGGPFSESYSVLPGLNRLVPVDVYIPGCPPRPDALLYGLMMLHKKIDRDTILRRRTS